MAGALIQWLRDELGFIDSVGETDAIARSVATTDGVFVVPAFTGLGAPWWDADARGAILGLTRGAGRAHIVRAALESIAYQVCDLARAMAEGARRVLGCDLAVASTGVAGPDPDERGNPVGRGYLALAAPDGTWVRKIQQGLGRERVRHVSASHGFDLARRYLSGLEVK